MTTLAMDSNNIGAVSDDEGQPKGAQLPLALVSEGETVRVAKVRGSQDVKQRLATLGFIAGTDVELVSRIHGDVVVKVKGATFGINRQTAMKIVTA